MKVRGREFSKEETFSLREPYGCSYMGCEVTYVVYLSLPEL